MKIWEANENQDPILKGDTDRFSADKAEQAPNAIQEIIDREWPESTITWKREISRSSALLCNPEAEEWQCGAYGPNKRYCRRVIGHTNCCSDLFTPADRTTLTKRLAIVQKDEFGVILGKEIKTPTERHCNAAKLRAILKENK